MSSHSKELLTADRYAALHASDGRLVNEYLLRKTVFFHGVHPEIARSTWKSLLGMYPPDATTEQRIQIDNATRARYEELVRQTDRLKKALDPTFLAHLKIIRKDVLRTDRDQQFFADDANPNLRRLENMLSAYACLDQELGYVQGMNDLLSPIFMALDDEADAFWIWAAFLARCRQRFLQIDLRSDLELLRQLTWYMDRQLCEHLDKCAPEPGGLWLFCHRWLLLCFKREFTWPEVLVIWERMWAAVATRRFEIFFALGIFEVHRERLLSIHEPDQVLKYLQDLSMKIDAHAAIKRAQEAVWRLRQDAQPPPALSVLIDAAESIAPPSSNHAYAPPVRDATANRFDVKAALSASYLLYGPPLKVLQPARIVRVPTKL